MKQVRTEQRGTVECHLVDKQGIAVTEINILDGDSLNIFFRLVNIYYEN